MQTIAVTAIIVGRRPYAVVIASIPEPHRTHFQDSQRGAQGPIIAGFDYPVAYWTDWLLWLGRQPDGGT